MLIISKTIERVMMYLHDFIDALRSNAGSWLVSYFVNFLLLTRNRRISKRWKIQFYSNQFVREFLLIYFVSRTNKPIRLSACITNRVVGGWEFAEHRPAMSSVWWDREYCVCFSFYSSQVRSVDLKFYSVSAQKWIRMKRLFDTEILLICTWYSPMYLFNVTSAMVNASDKEIPESEIRKQ